MTSYCITALRGGVCTVDECPKRHDPSHCELCNSRFPPSTLKQHEGSKMHLKNLASSGTPDPGTLQPTPPQPTSSNLQSATPINTFPPSASHNHPFTPPPDAGPRVTVSGEDGLDFVVEGSGTAEDPSFSPSSQTIVIEKTKVLSSLSVLSVTLSPLPGSCFTASLVDGLMEVQQNKPRKVIVSFQPSSVGTYHAVLCITFHDRTKPYEQGFTVERELRGRAILRRKPVSNAGASTAASTAEDTAGIDGTGITVSHDFGLELSALWPPSGEAETKELIITKSSTNPAVSFKAVRILSTDDSVNGSFSALFGGDFAVIQPRQRHIVLISFHPRREGLCEANLELTFHNHKRKVDFVVNRVLSGWARREPSGQEHYQNGSAVASRSQQANDWGYDDTSVYSDEDEELWDEYETGVSVSSEDGLDFGIVERKRPNGPFATAMTSLTIKLEDGFPAVTFLNERIKTADGSDSDFVATFEGDTRTIQPGTESTVCVMFSPKYDGLFRATLALFFYDNDRAAKFVVRRRLQGIAGSLDDHKLFESLDQEDSKKSTKKHRYVPPQSVILLPTPGRKKKSRKLPDYEVPSPVKDAIEDSNAERPYDKKAPGLVAASRPSKLTMETYVEWFNALLQVEDGHQQSDILCQPSYVVEVEDRGKRRNVQIENNDEDLLPEVIVGDYLWLDDIQEDIRYEARIADAEVFSRSQGQQAVLKISLKLPTEFNLYPGAQFILQFRLNRITLRRQFHALAKLSTTPLRLLFPSAADVKPMQRLSRTEINSLDLVNEGIRDDNQQLQTVVSILEQPKGSVPFIIFGPPGTGKTTTVVESMMQLIRRDDTVKILACTPSNAAADLLVDRLAAAGLHSEQLYRLNAFSREESSIPEDVRQFSVIPKHVELLAFRVVLSTCSSAGMLKILNVPVGHFSHIVIDEAAQAEEPLAMIPILTLSDEKTNIILAGDPHQLRPVIKSPTASKSGLRKSYLERLMDMRAVYGLDTQVGKTIVDLQLNRRSHGAIIAWPNRYLYEDRMRARADASITDRLLQWSELPKKGFPIIFHGIRGTEKRTKRSPSYYNILEASIVRDYCVKLTTDPERKIYPDEIGIIAPYKAQVRTIRELLRTVRLAGISVGSVEQFQGQERKVIIMATTRSNEEYHPRRALGFLMNPRRMNVAITRAQSLLIMIGDPAALGKDEFWRTFINYVRLHKGSTGKEPSWKADEEVPVPVREIVQRSGGVAYGNEFINGKSDKIYRFYFGDE